MNTHLRFILAISIIAVGPHCVETRAVDYPLTTEAKVDYARLKSGFANPPEESKLRCFWFWQYGVATKKSITQDLEAMKAKGYGGALLGDNGGPEGQVGPVFMSEEWKENFAHAVKETDRLGLELSLNIQSGWGDPGINPVYDWTTWRQGMNYPGAIQLGLGKRLLETYPWWRFESHPEWAEKDCFAAGIPGEVRFIYQPKRGIYNWKGTIVKHLEPDVSYSVFYFDPVTGRRFDKGPVINKGPMTSSGEYKAPRLPSPQDWVLVLERVKKSDAGNALGTAIKVATAMIELMK